MTARNFEANAPITMPGFRAREQAAKDRREANKVDPDVRAARVALLERRDAAMAAGDEAERQKASRPAELYRETLALVPDNLLEELQRTLPSLATRQMGDIVGDVMTERRRARRAADFAVPSAVPAEAPQKAAKAR